MKRWHQQLKIGLLALSMLGLLGCAQAVEPTVETAPEPEEDVMVEVELTVPEIEPEPEPEPEPEIDYSVYDPNYKYVALTFDDGPVANTEILLDGLAERNASATFFCLGIQAVKYPETLQRIVADGHQLCSHSDTHLNMTKVSTDTWLADFQTAEDKFNEILDTPDATYWLRPPYGLIYRSQYSSVDVPMVLWSVDPRDWELLDTQAVVDTVLSTVGENDIILLHDTHLTSIEAALQLIDEMSELGYRFVTVEKLLEFAEIEVEASVIYRSATGRSDSIWYGS